MQVGDRLTSGDIYAVVHESSLLDHRLCVPRLKPYKDPRNPLKPPLPCRLGTA